MSKVLKLLAKMRANPRDWRIEDVEAVVRHYGITVRKPAGSHVIFDHPESVELLSIPAYRPIKPVYVRKFLDLIDLLEGLDENP